jgi:hypothetical protein
MHPYTESDDGRFECKNSIMEGGLHIEACWYTSIYHRYDKRHKINHYVSIPQQCFQIFYTIVIVYCVVWRLVCYLKWKNIYLPYYIFKWIRRRERRWSLSTSKILVFLFDTLFMLTLTRAHSAYFKVDYCSHVAKWPNYTRSVGPHNQVVHTILK